MLKRFAISILGSACLTLVAGSALADKSVNLGLLACDMSKGIGLILIEKQKMTCEFRPVSGPVEQYPGSVTDFGIEIGEIKEGHLVWGVFSAALLEMQPGALAGHYAGVSADVAAGLGVGANALMGGTGKGFVLQPVSVEGEVGVNIAAGIRTMTLHPAN